MAEVVQTGIDLTVIAGVGTPLIEVTEGAPELGDYPKKKYLTTEAAADDASGEGFGLGFEAPNQVRARPRIERPEPKRMPIRRRAVMAAEVFQANGQ